MVYAELVLVTQDSIDEPWDLRIGKTPIQLMPHKGAVAIRIKTAEQIQGKPGEFQHANSH